MSSKKCADENGHWSISVMTRSHQSWQCLQSFFISYISVYLFYMFCTC